MNFKLGQLVEVREPSVHSKKNPIAYRYVGRVVTHRRPGHVIGITFEGEDGSTILLFEKVASVFPLSPLEWLAHAAGGA